MKKFFKKWLCVVLAVALGLCALSGCSSEPNNSGDEQVLSALRRSSNIELTANKYDITTKKNLITINGTIKSINPIKEIGYELYDENGIRIYFAPNGVPVPATYNGSDWEFKDMGVWGGKNTVRVIAKDTAHGINYVDIAVDYTMGEPYYDYDDGSDIVDAETGIHYVNNQLRISFDYDTTEERMWEIVRSFSGEVVGQAFYSQIYVKMLPGTLKEIKSLCNQLEQLDEVNYANEVILSGFDPMPISRNVTGSVAVKSSTWGKDAIQLSEALKNSGLSLRRGIRIGVVDDGFEPHKDVENKITFLPDGKHNTNGDHGTVVSGIIATTSKEYKKVGIATEYCHLLCVDYSLGETPRKRSDRIYDALRWTVEKGVKVVNFSIGYSNSIESGQYVMPNDEMAYHRQQAVDITVELLSRKIDFVIVQGSGNGNADYVAVDAVNTGLFASLTEESIVLPKNSSVTKQDILNRIIVVGAAQKNKDGTFQQTSYSNWGNRVDICAPGYNIYAPTLNNQYGDAHEGTSVAAPIVTGVCALVWSVEGNSFSGADVKDIVCNPNNTIYTVLDNSTWNHNPLTPKRLVNAKLALEDAVGRVPRTDPKENHARFETSNYTTAPVTARSPKDDPEKIKKDIFEPAMEWYNFCIDGGAFPHNAVIDYNNQVDGGVLVTNLNGKKSPTYKDFKDMLVSYFSNDIVSELSRHNACREVEGKLYIFDNSDGGVMDDYLSISYSVETSTASIITIKGSKKYFTEDGYEKFEQSGANYNDYIPEDWLHTGYNYYQMEKVNEKWVITETPYDWW